MYNTEVHRSHSYDVSEFAILAHTARLDCTKTPVYRGGGDLTPKYNLGEVKIKNGKVQPTGHHEIRPKIEMPVERFEGLLKQVVLEPIS